MKREAQRDAPDVVAAMCKPVHPGIGVLKNGEPFKRFTLAPDILQHSIAEKH